MQYSFIQTVQEFLDLGKDPIGKKQTLLLCLVAYLFGVMCRSFYLWTALDIPGMLLNGVPMISTEDGYYFASIVNSNLSGDAEGVFRQLTVQGGLGSLVTVSFLLVKILPFSLEQIAVFIPMVFAPLVALPMIYIGRLLGSTAMGFGAGLLTTVGLPYMKRTSFAYFDTDIFGLFGPSLVVAVGIYAIINPGLRQILILGLVACISKWLDKAQIAELIYATAFVVYVLVNLKNPNIYRHVILLCFPLWSYIWYEIMLYMIIVYGVLWAQERWYPQIPLRVWQAAAALFVIYTVYQSPLYGIVRSYMGSYGSASRGVGNRFSGQGWNFYQVAGTIVEARKINLIQLTRETSGYIFLFWLGLAGAILALFRYPLLVVGGVLLGIGLFSLEGGIRFSLYLVPILSVGTAYLILLISRYAYVKQLHKIKFLNWAIAALLLAGCLYPGYDLAYNYRPRTVAQLPQVDMLQRLNEKTSSEDYIISWWDYGYVMSFYSDMKNIINGGKHNRDNYVVSKAFASTSPILAANLIRESVEIYEENDLSGTAMDRLLGARREGFNPADFINSMASPNYALQREKTREIYIYMPYQMLPIYGVVRYFSDLNLATGKVRRAPLITTRHYRVDQENQRILLPNSVVADITKGELLEKGKVVGKLNSIHSHQVKNNQSEMTTTNINSLGYYHVIISGYYGIVYVMGPEAFKSNFTQMFFFRNYDERYFELIENNPLAMLYRLKI